MIAPTDRGLWCEAGGFHVDPWRPVERAVVTHAHGDHAAPGCAQYLSTPQTAAILRVRLGPGVRVRELAPGETAALGGTRVSLHAAGHVLGSAQVRVEGPGGVWVVSGDYKRRADPTCAPFEPLRCDVFISESTFGLPIYRWPDEAGVFGEIHSWWRENQSLGRTSILYAYTLGKAQRLLAGLDASTGPIGVHGAVARINEAYASQSVRLPPTLHAAGEAVKTLRGVGMIVAPPSAARTPWVRKFGAVSTAQASGWMRLRGTRRRGFVDRGFVLSDHADWPDLLRTIEETGAQRVGVTHGYSEALARWLRERGREAFVIPTRYEGEKGAEEPAAEPS